jgi:UrcA family protein
MTMRSIIVAASAAALLACGAPALAKTGLPSSGTPVSVVVPLADLNLDTASGSEMALRRILAATRQTCGDLADDMTPAAGSRRSRLRSASSIARC